MATATTKLILALCLLALTLSAKTESTVQVCVHPGANSGFALERAKRITSQIMATAGVVLEWRSFPYAGCRTVQQTRTVILDLTTGIPLYQYPGALAYARVYESVHIIVMIDRIRVTAGDPGPLLAESIRAESFSLLLAHVMAHEIAHILQGIPRHSPSGVMKARWNSVDHARMAIAPLPFAPEDVDLIQRGLHSRAASLGAPHGPSGINTGQRP